LTLAADSFGGLATLACINCGNVTGLANLSTITFGNLLTSPPALPLITVLNASFCGITAINEHDFDGMPALRWLSLADNNLLTYFSDVAISASKQPELATMDQLRTPLVNGTGCLPTFYLRAYNLAASSNPFFACPSCPAGAFCEGGAGAPTPCGANTFATGGVATCIPCPTNTYATGAAVGCVVCPPALAASACNASATWRDTITVVADGAGSWVNASVYLVPAGDLPGNANVSCVVQLIGSPAIILCALPFLLPTAATAPVLTQLWVAHAGTGGVPQRLNTTVTLLPSSLTALSTSGGLGLAPRTPGTGRIVVSLPAPRLAAADWTAAGLQPPSKESIDSLAVWLAGTPCADPAWESSTTLSCTTAATDATNVAVIVQLAGMFNVSVVLPSLLSTPSLAVSTDVQLLPIAAAPTSTMNITLAGVALCVGGTPQLATASVAGVPCTSVVCTPGFPDAALCVGWNSSNPSVSSLRDSPQSTVNTTVTWVDLVFRAATCNACVILATRPVLTSVTPTSIAAPGVQVVVTGTGLMDATRALPTVYVGGALCGSISVLSQTVVQCNTPTLLPSAPGFPMVSVVVVNAAGAMSNETLRVKYPATFTVVWLSTPTLATLPGDTLVLSLTLRIVSREAATCSLAVNVTSCGMENPLLASRPVGIIVSATDTTLVVGASGTLDAASTDLLLTTLMVSGASGCTGTLTAACIDAAGQTASTAGQPTGNPTVTLPAWRADWNLSHIPDPFVVVPGELPVFPAVFSLTGIGGVTPAIASTLSCVALLLPTSATRPPLAKPLDLVPPRDVLASDAAIIGALNTTAATVAFAGLTTSAAPLGLAVTLYAECTWVPTSERMRLPTKTLSNLQLSLDWVQPLSMVFGYTAVLLHLEVPKMNPAPIGGHPAFTMAECEIVLINATARGARLGSIDPLAVGINSTAPAGTVVAISPILIIEASPAVSVYVRTSCKAWGQTLTSPPLLLTTATLAIRQISAPPTTFIASDTSSPWPLEPQLVVAVVTAHNDAAVVDAACTVTSSMPATDLVVVDDTTTLASLRSIQADPHTGVIVVPRFAIHTSPTALNTTLIVECQHSASGDPPTPLRLSIPATLLTVQQCTPPTTTAAVGSPLPAFSVGVVVTTPNGTRTSPCNAASGGTGMLPFALPPIVCTIVLNVSASSINDTSSVFLQQTAIVVTAASHTATFGAFTIVAPQGQTYGLTLACAVGGLVLPPTLAFTVEIDGCRPGQVSESVTCVTCGGGEFSLGGMGAKCIDCPRVGATCVAGILTLLPHYFRPASQADEPLGPNTELHPCYNSEACTLEYRGGNVSSNNSAAIYGCAYGYTGPLCGVCDANVNYARFGEACAICWNAGASWLLLLFVVTLVLAVLSRVALRKESGRSDSSIVLRIALGFLQAVGSLRVFRAGSTKAYDNVMGWTEVVSASPLSVGALQCILRLPYLFQYATTILLPVLASAAVVVVFLSVTTGRSVQCKPQFSMDTHTFKSAVAAWWASKRHLSTLLFVLFLTYMPIVSASLRALDCIDPIAGVRYLRSDLHVECGVGQHSAARGLAYTVLIAVGAGFPAGLAWLLGTARNEQLVDPAFHATWGFLFDGYRAPKRTLAASPIPVVGEPSVACSKPIGPGKLLGVPTNQAAVVPLPGTDTTMPAAGGAPAAVRGGRRRSSLLPERLGQTWVVSGDSRVWWEAIVLCRKAGVVLLAVTLTNPYLQCVGATLWFAGAAVLQARYTPYSKRLFNGLEMASLVVTFLTAVISTALLQYNVGVASADLHPPDAMTGIEVAVTVLLAVMNVGTFATFAILWLRLQCARARGIVRRTSFVTALTGRVAGLRASIARRRSGAAVPSKSRTSSLLPTKLLHSSVDGGAALPAATENPLHVRAASAAPSALAVESPAAGLEARSHHGGLAAPPGSSVDAATAAFPDVPSAATSHRHLIGVAAPPPLRPPRPGCADDAKHAPVQPSVASTRTAADSTPAVAGLHERGVAFAATPVFRMRRRI